MKISRKLLLGIIITLVVLGAGLGLILMQGGPDNPSPNNSPPPADNLTEEETKSIILRNNYIESASIDLTVIRKNTEGSGGGLNATNNVSDRGIIVHQSTTEVQPNSGTVVYNTAQLETNEVVNITVKATYNGKSDTVRLRTTDCYEDVNVVVTPSNEISVTSEYTC